MEKLQLYLSMYEALSTKKEENHIVADFLQSANPFDLRENTSISSKFIDDYDTYFAIHPKNMEQAYQFVLLFLKSLNCNSLVSSFMEYSINDWKQGQFMICE